MFREINIKDINESAAKLIGSDWMLITAGVMNDFNTMTAAWGGLGYLWNKPVAYTFIRPQRYTYLFAEKYDYFTLSFFKEEHREILNYCGSCSGKDKDKVKETGLISKDYEGKTVYFEQAHLVLICRKLYFQDVNPENFLDKSIHKVYPLKDYHRMYIGEIEKTLVR
jgi:flavin reductase (DIM6/NTAB) family NADH-FMN oxidoreductase RutF